MSEINVKPHLRKDGTKVRGHKKRSAQSGKRRGADPAAAASAAAGIGAVRSFTELRHDGLRTTQKNMEILWGGGNVDAWGNPTSPFRNRDLVWDRFCLNEWQQDTEGIAEIDEMHKYDVYVPIAQEVVDTYPRRVSDLSEDEIKDVIRVKLHNEVSNLEPFSSDKSWHNKQVREDCVNQMVEKSIDDAYDAIIMNGLLEEAEDLNDHIREENQFEETRSRLGIRRVFSRNGSVWTTTKNRKR